MKIVFCTDGSAYSDAAADLLGRIPLEAGTEITLLSVLERHGPFDSGKNEIHPDERARLSEIEDEMSSLADSFAARAAQQLLETGAALRTEVRSGRPVEEILAAAEEQSADLIVVGALGQGERKRFALGRVARGVLRSASCSVLIARPARGQIEGQARPERLRILASLASDEDSGVNLRALARLPLADRVEVTILSILTVGTTLYQRDVVERLSRTWQAHKAETEHRLAAATEALKAATPHVEPRLIDGGTDASDEMLEAAELLGADLVMVDRTKKGRVLTVLQGSVATEVAEHAHCSVWVAAE